MRWASALSQRSDTVEAVHEVVEAIQRALDGERVDALWLFATVDHVIACADLPARVLRALPARRLIGCTGSGIIGGGIEIEHRRALSLTAACLPGVELDSIHLEGEELAIPNGDGFVLLTDPFSFDAESCTSQLDRAFPGATCIGGLASGGQGSGTHALFIDDRVHRTGAALLALRGDVVIDPIVAQGCRPIGDPMIVTESDGHFIHALEGRAPGEVLSDIYASLPERDRQLFRTSLFVGVEMKNQLEYHAGDFLVRNIVGLHQDGSALAIAAELAPYKVVQFHLRDAQASESDLLRLLDAHASSRPKPLGALLFSCVGRGEHLYGRSNHDSDAFAERLGTVPLGGFFCNGEIGPVGGTTFVHGYTSAFALVRPRS